MFGSEAITRGVRVRVESFYVPDQSAPNEGRWLFGYRVTLSNESEAAVQLTHRHWVVTDGDGREEQVRGPGVIGEQPILEPGESFEYTSACPLATPVGSMRGSYQMLLDGGERFDAEIAPFTLGDRAVLN